MRTVFLLSCVIFLSSFVAAEPSRVTAKRVDGETVLFDAARDAADLFRHYTASWKEGSDLVPVPEPAGAGHEGTLGISYRGSRGMACSTLYVGELPNAKPGHVYNGVRLTVEYDGDDYAKLGVNLGFTDSTTLSYHMTLDKGRRTYEVVRGFRREKSPPDWALLGHVQLNASAEDFATGGDARDLSFRVVEIAMVEAEAPPEETPMRDRFSERVFSPQLKEIQWRDGAFSFDATTALFLPADATERTQRTAEIFSRRLYGITGRQLPVQRFDTKAPEKGIVLKISPSAEGDGPDEKARKEGYRLSVAPDRVVITGFDEPGLHYGTLTFLQLLRQPMRAEPVPCVEILDWPDMPIRLCRLEHTHHFRNSEVREKRGIDYLIDWTERYVAGNKLNLFMIDLSPLVCYERRPEFDGRERFYSLDDLRRFGDFCRDNFIDLCPAWQIGGHANWWLTIGYHPELRETGWNSQGDVTHPDHNPIVFDCMQDVIDALQPKYLSPKSDEWWHDRKTGETPPDLPHGKTRAQAFLDFHLALHRWLAERGITMAVFHDMLTPYHNGKRYDVYKTLDQLPKDTVIMVWSSYNPKMIRWFADRGFPVWANLTGMFFPSPEDIARIEGFGKGLYSWGQWNRGLIDEYSALVSPATLFRCADFAWNAKSDDRAETLAQIRDGRLIALQQMAAVPANPHAGEKVRPLDIGGCFNETLGRYILKAKPDAFPGGEKAFELPGGTREIGFIPTRLGQDGGKDCLVLRENDPEVAVPGAGRFASLIFLHTALIDRPDDERAKGVAFRRWPYGYPLGDYEILYQNGETAVLPIRLGMNLKRFDTETLNRPALDARCTWSLKDRNGGDAHFFQWEWVNPHPDWEIEKITVRHANEVGASLALLAVSGREVRKVDGEK